MKRIDYYKVLGVESRASADTIKKAYRKLAMEYHPDRRPGDAKAMEKFKEIAEAYSILSNPTKRATYDRQRMGMETGSGYSRPYEAYETQTHRSHRRPTQPPDPTTEWTPPRPPRSPHIRPETEGLFKYAHFVSYGAVAVFALMLVCYLFYAISETSSQENRSATTRRNSANYMAAQTVTAQVSRRMTQEAPTHMALAQTGTSDPVMTRRSLSAWPEEWIADHHIGVACSIELDSGDNGETDCGDLEPIEVVYSYGHELLLRINLDPAQTEYRRVLFVVQYGRGKPTGWTVNIGDSRSNDGFGGDAGHQVNNAEIQVNDGRLSIYGRNGVPRASQELVRIDEAVEAGSALAIEVGDGRVRWWHDALGQDSAEEVVSPYLFALGGQTDGKGGVNYQVYAAFDRVVWGAANRNGDGVMRVDIRLLP